MSVSRQYRISIALAQVQAVRQYRHSTAYKSSCVSAVEKFLHFLCNAHHEAFDEYDGAFADVSDALECWKSGLEEDQKKLRLAFAGKVTPSMCIDCMAVYQSDNAALKKSTMNMGSRGKVLSWGVQ